MLVDKEFFHQGTMVMIDKEPEWTSFGVVKKVRWLITQFAGRKIKVGHAGTLDPFATGLLILCTGKKTKEIDSYQAQEKEYEATVKLGATTPSFDIETEEDEQFETSHITKEKVEEALKRFIGEIKQMPPNYSAKKVNGVRAYTLARKGEQADLKEASITIYEIEIIDFTMPYLKIRVKCGKGTYIRALARDIGKALDSGAYLTELRRTKIGEYDVKDAMSLQDFENKLNLI
jgi:tRNA pseudouridine55 synthase